MSRKVVSLALCAMLLALNFSAKAQPPRKTIRIGYLGNNQSSLGLRQGEKDFVEELRKRGWVEGQNLGIDRRYWENRIDRLRAQAADLIHLEVDIIVTNTGTAAQAAKKVTTTIPVVMVSSADAVNQGLAVSLARPGENITGLTSLSSVVAGKRFELLKETFPSVSRVGVITCPAKERIGTPIGQEKIEQWGLGQRRLGRETWEATRNAARVQKIDLLPVAVRGPGDVEGALGVVMRERVDALFPLDCPRVPYAEIVEIAIKTRLPAIHHSCYFVTSGGLMSYGADQKASFRRAAHFVDKILKGAKPAELPIEQPTKFELVINLKTAKQIGVTIPPEVLMWADEVIK